VKLRISRWSVVIVSSFLLAVCNSIQAQQPNKIPRIGYLSAFDKASEATRAEGVRLALRDLGYLEGQNIAIEYRYAETKRERYPYLVADLVRLKVDVIVLAGGLLPIQAAKNATKTIPIVMVGVGADPVKTGLVESIARPGATLPALQSLTHI
jgi:putative ABC transport system substrate-binding protein